MGLITFECDNISEDILYEMSKTLRVDKILIKNK